MNKIIYKIFKIFAVLALTLPAIYPSVALAAYCQCYNTSNNTNFECHTLPSAAESPSVSKQDVQNACTEQCIALRSSGAAGGVYTSKGDVTGKVAFGVDVCPPLQSTQEVLTTKVIDDLKISKPALEINIPNLTFSDVKTQIDEEGYLSLPWLAEYISAAYKFGVIVASIFAAVIIINKGFTIIMSAGGEDKAAAYKRIFQIIIGLGLVWGSYIILYFINPDLVNFKTLKVLFIRRTDIKDLVTNAADNGETVTEGGQTGCLDPKTAQNISGIATLGNVSWAVLDPDAAEGLKKAVAIAKERKVELLVTSAARSYATQQKLWEAGLDKNRGLYPNASAEELKSITRKEVAPPSCSSPHMQGRAIDVCIKGTDSCGRLKAIYRYATGGEITTLQEIMKAAGWKRYCGEWWHFEYNCSTCPTDSRSPNGCPM